MERNRQKQFRLLLRQETDDVRKMDAAGRNHAGKDGRKAVLFSAIIPGTGEAYAGSWWKAAGFFLSEVTLWVVKDYYHDRGDRKYTDVKSYADLHWSEDRYWTYVYWKGISNGYTDLPWNSAWDAYIQNHQPLPADVLNQAKSKLREWESRLPGFTHILPGTKTQQYYEMIGKYTTQFGPAWDDASYFETYNAPLGVITPNNKYYMDLRKLSNELYAKARTMGQLIILNHIISAIDAGFTVKWKNQKMNVKLTGNLEMVNEEVVDFIGVAVRF